MGKEREREIERERRAGEDEGVVDRFSVVRGDGGLFLKDKIFSGQGKKKRTKVIGVIPARHASTRFPGKPWFPFWASP